MGSPSANRWLQSITRLCSTVYEEEKKTELMDNAKNILKAVLAFAKVTSTDIQLIDDADWTLFHEIIRKLMQSQEESSDEENEDPQRMANANTKTHQAQT